MAISIGCGSWADAEYRGLIYPNAFPSEMRLAAYAMWFDHVEVNASYYSIPKAEAVEKWVELTPPSFRFDLRMPRSISQGPAKAGRDGRRVALLLKNLQPLVRAQRMGVFLLVLSPTYSPKNHKLVELDPLIERLRPHTLAVEFRHALWAEPEYREEAVQFFRERRLVWVSLDMPRLKNTTFMPSFDEVTHPDLAYLRLHGRNPGYAKAKSAEERHTYAYPPMELKEIAERVRGLSRRAKNVRVVANNHARDFAPRTALTLKEILETGVRPLSGRPVSVSSDGPMAGMAGK